MATSTPGVSIGPRRHRVGAEFAGALVVVALAAAAAPAFAQQSPKPCQASEYRQFDFWLGRWEVRSPDGKLQGTSHISRASGACAILEQWTAANGVTGTSLNWYDAARGKWHQAWVGGAGAILSLAGGLDEHGAMALTGTGPRHTSRGDVLDRITWTPLDGARVKQQWDISADEGQTWRTVFTGIYSRGR